MDPLELRIQDSIAWIEFGDPEKRNLLTVPLLEALPLALAEAEVRGARVVVLRGRGDIWSGGYDIGEIPADLFDADPRAALEHPFERCMRAVEACALPTIAAVNGHAIGGGVELAVSCDLRWARAGAKLGVTAARLGLVYPHTGVEKFLRLLGPANARRLLFTADLIDTAEALRIGLVDQVVEAGAFDAEVAGLAVRIAAAAPIAVQGMKHVLQRLEEGTPLDAAAVGEILRLRQRSFASDDFREGRAAFAEKRPPRFRGR